MYFKEIDLTNFRNYENQRIDFHHKVNIIIGENAQGKTNLLEALYIMSLGKSFRTSKDNEMIRFGSDLARVKTLSEKDGEDLSIEIGLIKNKKSLKIDGIKKSRLSELLENVYVVIFSPDDLRIVKEEPEKRRKFIDRELCQLKPVYYDSLSKYKKALSQRNFLLKEERVDLSVLDIWDIELAKYGAKIIAYRGDFIEKLREISRKIHRDLTEGRERLDLHYESDIPLEKNGTTDIPKKDFGIRESFSENSVPKKQKSALPAEGSSKDITAVRDNFYHILKESRKNDLKRRTTLRGPHRDDLRIEIDNIDVRNFGSQGQQRTSALSLKLVELMLIEEETGEKPILLLDDVLSELDKTRQRQLITSFGDVQIFITATELSDEITSQLEDYAIFTVKKGAVSREDCKK